MKSSDDGNTEFKIGQRVHSATDTRRIGTVKFVGHVEGYSGTWIGVDWDGADGRHDGSVSGVRYFQAKSSSSASFVRPQNLSAGISLAEALQVRYRPTSTEEEEDEMYVLSASNKRIAVQLLGKDKIQDKLSRIEELTSASVSYMGVSFHGPPCEIARVIPNLKELDLTGNLLSDWRDVGAICQELPALTTLNLSNNLLSRDINGFPVLTSIQILVLNNTGIRWMEVEVLKGSIPNIIELHLMGNGLDKITPISSSLVEGFSSLRLLNLEDNSIIGWEQVLKLSQLRSLEQLYLNRNGLNCIWYPSNGQEDERINYAESHDNSYRPFHNLRCLLIGGNDIWDLASIDSLNYFPNLMDVRLSDNPVADPGKGGVPRFVLIARLANVKILNGSEVSPRERKESEIRYIRLVMSKMHNNPDESKLLHPRYTELKRFHGIEDERSSAGREDPQKMSSGLISVTLKYVGASLGEKPQLTKKLPASIMIGKLKLLCESFFKLQSIKPVLYLQEGSPLPMLLDDDMASLVDLGVGNESTILVDEQN